MAGQAQFRVAESWGTCARDSLFKGCLRRDSLGSSVVVVVVERKKREGKVLLDPSPFNELLLDVHLSPLIALHSARGKKSGPGRADHVAPGLSLSLSLSLSPSFSDIQRKARAFPLSQLPDERHQINDKGPKTFISSLTLTATVASGGSAVNQDGHCRSTQYRQINGKRERKSERKRGEKKGEKLLQAAQSVAGHAQRDIASRGAAGWQNSMKEQKRQLTGKCGFRMRARCCETSLQIERKKKNEKKKKRNCQNETSNHHCNN